MADLLTVKSGHTDSTVALWARDDRHPGGEVFIAGPGEFQVARTRQVEAALKAGTLIEVTKETPVVMVEVEPDPALPDDFPARRVLVDAGFVTVQQVQGATDEALQAIDGIGKATLRTIREAL